MTTYLTMTRLDEYSTGGWGYVATHPELPGCVAQGDTPGEARADLDLARADYIAHLVKDGVPVPPPLAVQNGDVLVVDVQAMTAWIEERRTR